MSGWVRVENTMPENLKVAPISDKAFRLWLHAICYCSRARSSGRVPVALMTSLSMSATKKTVDELIDGGLVERVSETMYLVHDYLDYNPSRERIDDMRESGRERTARWRERNEAGDGVSDPVRDASQTRHPRARDRSVSVTSLFNYWRTATNHAQARATRERLSKIQARLAEGYTADQIRKAIDGAARGAFVNDAGKRFDDIELICRNGAKLESFIERADAKPAANVTPMRPAPINRQNRWQAGYEGVS